MTFQNSSIDIQSLPNIEKLVFQKLNKEYLWMRITFLCVLYILLMAITWVYVFFTEKFSWWVMPSFLTAVLALLLIKEVVGFKIKGFVLREHDISYQGGILFFSRVSIPFNRIQHTEVTQGPFERMFDLARVKVYTAGGSSSDISIPGLTEKQANELKEHINTLSSIHV